MIISGGLNIYPKEIENFLDGIEGIEESAVIGIQNKDFGEAVLAVIVQKKGYDLKEKDIIQNVKDNLANFKVPKRVVIVDDLPRNTMGKWVKFKKMY